jgi:copper oxidase (laccase) domain-containing protein
MEESMTEPIVYCVGGIAVAALYGKDRPSHDRLLASRHGARADNICFIKAPGNESFPGYLEIVDPVFGDRFSKEPDVYAEGVLLTEQGSGAVMGTADCMSLILTLRTPAGPRALITHAGRGAMSPTLRADGSIQNIVTLAYEKITAGVTHHDVYAHLTGSISAKHFLHDDGKAETLRILEPFAELFGERVFADRSRGALDLPQLARHQLTKLGVKKHRITHDGICTFASPDHYSYRKTRCSERNMVVVSMW